MSLRDPDHLSTYRFLGALERYATGIDRKTAPMTFPGFAGGGMGNGVGPFWGDGTGTNWGPLLPGAQFDYVQEAGDLWMNSAVAACMGWIGDNFSEPILRAYVKKSNQVEEEPIIDDPCVAVLEDPNPDYDADALWMATLISYLVSGNGYWLKAKSPGGVKMYLYYVPHWEIEIRWTTDGKQFISHYDHVVDGKRKRLEKTDVVHFRHGLDIRNVRSGLPQLMPVLKEICADNNAGTYTAAILRNMGVPGVMLMPESDNVTFDPDDAKDLKQLWSETTSGDNAGKPIVPSVKIKVQELTLSPEKMALDIIRRVPESRICAALKIPPTVVGLSVGEEQRTYANQAADERKAYRNCLIPLQKCFAKTLTKQLMPDFDRVAKVRSTGAKKCLRWDYSTVEAMNEERDIVSKRTIGEYVGGLVSQEEGRAKLGLGEPKKGDTFVLTKGMSTYVYGEPMPPIMPAAKPETAVGPDGKPIAGADGKPPKDEASKESADEDNAEDEETAEDSGEGEADEKSRPMAVVANGTPGHLSIKTVLHLDDYDRTEASDLLTSALNTLGLSAAYLAGTITDTQRHAVLGLVCDRASATLKSITQEFLAANPDSTKAIGPTFDAGLRVWLKRMRAVIGGALLAGALALLGPKDLDADDTANLDTARDAQMAYLDGFEADVRSGKQELNGTMPARAAMYGSAVWAQATNLSRDKVVSTAAAVAIAVAAGKTPKTALTVQFERAYTTSNLPCSVCSDRAAQGWQPIGTLLPMGDATCGPNCRCYWIFESRPVTGPSPSPSEMPIELPPEPVYPTHGVITVGPNGPVVVEAQVR